MIASPPAANCRGCGSREESLVQLGVAPGNWDILVALAGNPNTGKSTVFNALTGLRQHTGNWPGKTVTRAEGTFKHDGHTVKVVDLPGTYSLQAGSTDEEVARDFLLFGQPDVTVIVVDATRLERNLNLTLQVLEVTDRVVVLLNLMDEARRHGIGVDPKALERELGVPVIPAAARQGTGVPELRKAIVAVATGAIQPRPRRMSEHPPEVEQAIGEVLPAIAAAYPGLPNARWVALRLLNADDRVLQAVRSGELAALVPTGAEAPTAAVWATAGVDSGEGSPVATLLDALVDSRWRLSPDFHDQLTAGAFAEAERITAAVQVTGLRRVRVDLDKQLDRLLTSRWTGFPLMILLLALVFWITIAGANVPSAMLATLLIDNFHPVLQGFGATLGMPQWLNGLLFDGMYLATAWVIAVMLPPMAIFFPLFTLLEDFGYLPRVAFNMDRMFQRVGAHGKQALTMCMGFGCNAAGVVATRVIDSPRERLVAIITNNFSLCNGRWPTQILIASIFLGTLVPAHLAGIVSAAAVVGIALLGVLFMLGVSWVLTRTVLKGEATTFSLELPPYRPPRFWQTMYTSLIDRTLIVLWRAVVFALPAGAVIWLISNIQVGGSSIAAHAVEWLNPLGILIGLNGVILLAYVVAIPANEIVIPTILMLTVLVGGVAGVGPGDGVMFELDSVPAIGTLLREHGWTTLVGVNLMLFSLLHNPCSTTIYTIYKETRSVRWTSVATLMPVALGLVVCFLVAQVWRLLGA
ncbi:MAG: ferrous iron transport protein B [Gemmatimonadota bacterium]|nr:ferrous iron transport protein B [Gemmatimonadota bacterium]